MFHSSIRHRAIRILLLAGILQSFALGCDLKSPVEPDTRDGSALQVPNNVMNSVVPSGLSATALSWSGISISWERSPSATGYEVIRSTTGATGAYTQLTSTTATSYVNTGLTGSTTYCYQVRAVKTAGKNTSYSAFSSAACATTLAPPVVAPSETDAVPDAGRIVIKWKDNSADEDGFKIERSASPSGPWVHAFNVVANVTSTSTYNVSAEQQACFRVTAFNSIGPSLPSIPDCTTLPAGPTNLSASIAQSSINLTWTDNSAVEDGYKVSRSAGNGVLTELTSLPGNAVSYIDVSVTPDVVYRYVVQALKDGGSSVSSQVTAVLATSVPAAPTWAQVAFYLNNEGWGSHYLIFWWDAYASNNEAGFRLEYSPDGQSGWGLYATFDADVNYFQQEFNVSYGLPPSGCYRVIAFNELGLSSPSPNACVDIGGDPTDLTATAIDQEAIDLAWTDNALVETGYVVIRSTTYDGSYEAVAELPPNATSYRDTGLASAQESGMQWLPSKAARAGPTIPTSPVRRPAVVSPRRAPCRHFESRGTGDGSCEEGHTAHTSASRLAKGTVVCKPTDSLSACFQTS